jgi:hypothetical protein
MLLESSWLTSGNLIWGKAWALNCWAKLLEIEHFKGGLDVAIQIDNDIEFLPGWLAKCKRALRLSERLFEGRVAYVSPLDGEMNPKLAEGIKIEEDLFIDIKKKQGSGVCVYRTDYFVRYGLAPIIYEGQLGIIGDDWYYDEQIDLKGHIIVTLSEPLAIHVGKTKSIRLHEAI